MLLDAFGKSSQTKSSKGHPNQPHLYLESSLHASVQVPSQSSDEALVSSSLPLDCFQSLVKKRTDSGSTWNVKKSFGLLRVELRVCHAQDPTLVRASSATWDFVCGCL